MSYAPTTHTGRATAIQSLGAMLNGMKEKFGQRRSYRQTVAALSQLSAHELQDLGLSRCSIQSDAWKAVYGPRQQR